MAFLNNSYLKTDRRKRSLNSSGSLYDSINFLLGIAIIICSLVLFIEYKKYDYLFTIDFALAGTMNLVMGVKYFKRNEIIKTISLFVATVFLYVVAVISFIALW